MRPEISKFIEDFEREAWTNGSYRRRLGKAELCFLEAVWGPVFQYRFDGLQAEYPFKDSKGGQRFADFVYIKDGMRLLIEIDGFTTHARDISPGDFEDHLTRQNDLVLSGWLVLRFSANQVERQPQACQMQLKQAIGHWWSVTQSDFHMDTKERWQVRRRLLVQMAARSNGRVKPVEVARAFNISNRAAASWLKRFAEERVFSPQPEGLRSSVYWLNDYRGE